MAGERIERLGLCARLPNLHAPAAIRRGEVFAVRAKGDGRHPIGVLFDEPGHLAILGLVELHALIRTAERDELMIRRNIRRQHRIRLIPHTAHAVARRDIPQHHRAGLPAQPAACEQQLCIAREAQHIRVALRESEHAQRLHRLRVVKEDLPLPADRHQRGPRARRHRHHRAIAARLHKRLQRQIPRHRRRAIRARERDDRRGHIILLRRSRLARRILQRKPRDPALQQRHLPVIQLVPFRRHLRLLRLRAHLIHQRTVRVPRLHRRPTLTARQRALIRREIQPRLLLIRVVAIRADIAENRRDVIGIRHLRRHVSACGDTEAEKCDECERFHTAGVKQAEGWVISGFLAASKSTPPQIL